MTKKILIVAGIIGALSIVMDALGNLYFFDFIPDSDETLYNHAVLYQIIHALVLIGLVFLNRYFKPKYINVIFLMLVGGVIFTSGTMYLLSLEELFKYEFKVLKPFTAIGGILLIIGWLGIANLGINYKSKKR